MAHDALIEIRPKVIAEERASCGCTFVSCLEQAFDANRGCWCESVTTVVVPCRDDHRSVALDVASGGYETIAALASLMSERVAA